MWSLTRNMGYGTEYWRDWPAPAADIRPWRSETLGSFVENRPYEDAEREDVMSGLLAFKQVIAWSQTVMRSRSDSRSHQK